MQSVVSAISVAFLAVAGLTAGPITINFGGLSVATTVAVLAGDGTNYTQNGFTFTNTGTTHALVTWGTGSTNHPLGGNPATSLLAFYDTTPLGIAAADNSPFSLLGIDLAGGGANQLATETFGVTFTGHIVGGGTVAQTFTVNNFQGSPHLQTFTFSGFSNLASVSFTQGFFNNGDSFQFNNVVVDSSPAPEPSTLALFGSAALVMLVRRRKRA